MKTISKRFLKGALAMLLAVVMLFGTTITGFAAVVDKAETKANVDDCIWFNNTPGWDQPYVYLWNGASSDKYPGNKMTYDPSRELWYFDPSGATEETFSCIFNPGNDDGKTGNLTCPGLGYKYTYNTNKWDYIGSKVTGDLASVLKGEKIMFYIGEPDNWNRQYFYLKLDGKTVDEGQYVVQNDSNKYTSVAAAAVSGYKITHDSWAGVSISGAPKSGKFYLVDNGAAASCTEKGNEYSVTASLSSNSIMKGTNVGASRTLGTSTPNVGGSFTTEYYYTTDKKNFTKLNIASNMTSLETSELAAGHYYIYPVIFDGYIYTRGNELELTITDEYEYTVKASTGGQVKVGTTTSAENTGTCQPSVGVSIEAIPDDANGYEFDKWTFSDGTADTTENPYTFKPKADGATATANFKLKTYDFELNQTYKTPTEHQVDGAVCGVEIDDTAAGKSITHGSRKITVTPPANHKISSIKVNGTTKTVSDTSKYEETLDVADDVTIDVEYERLSYTVTFKDTTGETLSTQTVYHGDSATAPDAPAVEGHTFANWDQDYTNVQGNLEVHAVYTKIKYEVAVSVTPSTGGKVTINGEEVITKPIEYNTDVALVAIPATGYKFVGWYLNGENKGTDTTLNIKVGSTNVEYEARFEIKKVTVSVSATTGGTATLNGGTTPVTVSAGQSITLEAVADVGYAFVGWRDMKKNTIVSSLKSDTIPYNGEVEGEVEYRAEFAKSWNFTVDIPEGVSSIGYNGGTFDASTEFPIVVKDGGSVTLLKVNVTDSSKYRFKEWEITVNGNTTTSTDLPLTINFDGDIVVRPVVENLYTAVCTIATNRLSTPTYHGVSITNATSAVGEKIVYKVDKVEPGYKFLGWYDTGDNALVCLSNDPNGYETTQVKDGRNIIAHFYNNFKLEGGYNGTFSYVLETNSYTLKCDSVSAATTTVVAGGDAKPSKGTADGGELTVNGSNFTFVVDEENYGAPVEFTMTTTDNGLTYSINAKATALNKAYIYYVDSSGETRPLDDFVIGETARFTIPDDGDKYASYENCKAVNMQTQEPVSLGVENGNWTIQEMPEDGVLITPTYMQYVYVNVAENPGIEITGLESKYKQNSNVKFTVAPITGAAIKSCTVEGITYNPTVTDGEYAFDFVISNANVDISFEVEMQLEMSGRPITIDKLNQIGGALEIYVNGSLTLGGYANAGDEVTYKAIANEGFSFYGFYDANKVLKYPSSRDTVTFTATEKTELNPLFVRDLYFLGGINSWSGQKMNYDVATGIYSFVISATTNSFTITHNKDVYSSSYYGEAQVDSNMCSGVSLNKNNNDKYDTSTVSVSGDRSSAPITVYFNPDTQKLYAKATIDVSFVYLSSGRTDLEGAGSSAFVPTSEFTSYEGKYSIVDHKDVSRTEGNVTDYTCESYTQAKVKNQTITFKTFIEGSKASSYKVDYFYIYNIASKTSTYVKANDLGDNSYVGQYQVTEDCYIVPIFFENVEDLTRIYFDMSSAPDNWGPFVSCYPFGKVGGKGADTDMHGGWPGQLMIPSGDGKTFFTDVNLDDKSILVSGVTFCNYLVNSVPNTYKTELGIANGGYSSWLQTYDYKEPVYIKEAEYDVITFAAKTGPVNNPGNTINKNDTNWQLLLDRSGTKCMDLLGNTIDSSSNSTTQVADFYVLATGDNNYKEDTDYEYDKDFTAQCAVNWTIYDSDGKKIGQFLSGTMYDDINNTLGSDLIKALTKGGTRTKADIAGKIVKIKYDAQSGKRIDGRWYANTLDQSMVASVKVGLYDEGGNHQVESTATPHIADYGTAKINYKSVDYAPSTEVTFAEPEASLVATAKKVNDTNYQFKGWYIQEANGGLTPIDNSSPIQKVTVANDTVYVALFAPIAHGTLTINHLTYSNTKDENILSNDGLSDKTVELYKVNADGSKTLIDSKTSSSFASVSYPVEEGDTFEVTIRTEPKLLGRFVAWYTDSVDENGNETFEEVLTLDGHFDSEEVVKNTFTYTYKKGMQTTINIYSDVTKVSREARIIYKYINRFGEPKTITRFINLTDYEMYGFEGNGGVPRVPAYKDYEEFVNITTGDVVQAYTSEDIAKYSNDANYESNGVSNQITKLAPGNDMAQVIDYTLTWSVDDPNAVYKAEQSRFELNAIAAPKKYKITYEIEGDNDLPYVEHYYNELVEIEAPVFNSEEKKFSYWVSMVNDENGDLVEGQILSYNRFYAYRAVDTRHIKACYDREFNEWTPAIESVTYTRETADNGVDKIYTDYFLAYHNQDFKKIEELKKPESNVDIEYGLVLVRDRTYTYSGTGEIDFPEHDKIIEYVKQLIEVDKQNTQYENKKYNCYYYNLTNKTTATNLNRFRYYLTYDNTNPKYKTYAFAAYAYIIVDGKTYISSPANVNFFELANKVESNQSGVEE